MTGGRGVCGAGRRRRGLTLVEVLGMVILISLVSGMVHRIFSGTFSSFFKSSTKMTNLRVANLILEQLKRDLRMGVPGSSSLISLPGGGVGAGDALIFKTFDRTGAVKKVEYRCTNRILSREMEGEGARKISRAPVIDFKVELEPPAGGGGGGGGGGGAARQGLRIRIQVDETPEDMKVSEVNRTNAVELSALLFPPFFDSSVSYEERCWYAATSFRQ